MDVTSTHQTFLQIGSSFTDSSVFEKIIWKMTKDNFTFIFSFVFIFVFALVVSLKQNKLGKLGTTRDKFTFVFSFVFTFVFAFAAS